MKNAPGEVQPHRRARPSDDNYRKKSERLHQLLAEVTDFLNPVKMAERRRARYEETRREKDKQRKLWA